MYNHQLHQQLNAFLTKKNIDKAGKDNPFYVRIIASADTVFDLCNEIYGYSDISAGIFFRLIECVVQAYINRSETFKNKDEEKAEIGNWFLSNKITGMSLYVDRFCGNLKKLRGKLDYFEHLGVNFLHLMPIFESPENESDGGYAVSDFRKVDKKFGSLNDLLRLRKEMDKKDMYLMVDIVLNHTSNKHEWALKAEAGDKHYQDYFYMFKDRAIPDEYDRTMPEVFPDSSPGNFTYVPECDRWTMTVFHHYQWDLNYTNPSVLLEMLENIFFYANLGVDVLRIDAPAFIWKELGTSCQNLPKAHTLLRLIKQCVLIATPGMALLGEAIVAPKEILKYFGTGAFIAKECDFAYNATQMALQWDMLATSDTRIMLAAQRDIFQKPYGTSWITYTRCHDDIGLGYEDSAITNAGYNPYEHRKFLKDYYSGKYYNSPAKGALFSANPKTGDARISGSLASLCGLENAIAHNNDLEIKISIKKILLMQAHSFFLGGIPMIYYGDEAGYTNDYSYLMDPGKSYDNRWMHRPVIDWDKNKLVNKNGTIENIVFTATQKLISIRSSLAIVGDYKNIRWLNPHNIHVAGYLRTYQDQGLFCVFNFSSETANLPWLAFKEHDIIPDLLFDYWTGKEFEVGNNYEYLVMEAYSFHLFESRFLKD